jgi:hypothetical protein
MCTPQTTVIECAMALMAVSDLRFLCCKMEQAEVV